MAALSFAGTGTCRVHRTTPRRTPKRTVFCIGWDPEGVLGPPQTGHIARREFQKRLEQDVDARNAFQRQVREEQERRRAAREARVIPDRPAGLIEYFLDTEAREFEYEIARLRPRLNEEFFAYLQFELGQLRFAVSKTKDMEDRLIELEAVQKALLEGTEAYDKLETDFVSAKQRLAKIFQSKDKKATLLEMVETNELDRSLLALLDENIASAQKDDQDYESAGRMDTNDSLRLASLWHSMHAISKQLSPTVGCTGTELLEADTFDLHCFQSLTGTKFFVACEPAMQNLEALLKVIYELYTDYVLKNPFYEMEMPIRCELFEFNLSQATMKNRIGLLGR